MAAATILSGHASVLYTFYPPLTAYWTFYLGAALLIVGSFFWIGIMIVSVMQWKRENPGQAVPLPMYGMTINAILWGWTVVGVVAEVVFLLLPLSLGLTETVDVGLAKTLFAWTLHPIVYVWLIPAYVALYSIVPKEAGGRLFSDEMARVAFVMLLIFGLPVGFHHLYVDPFQSDGWKLLHGFGTFMVAIPTLLTGFTVIASLEIAGRLRGGHGLFGWLKALPWHKPAVTGGALSLLMLTFGGFGGMVNASYAMNTMVHNTMWVTAHFHLIFGGTTVILYFVIAYHVWPKLTGKPIHEVWAVRQLWLWFVGMTVLSIPWHYIGLTGMPRRTAWSPYDPEIVAQWIPSMWLMALGGLLLLISAVIFIWNLFRKPEPSPSAEVPDPGWAEPIRMPIGLPAPLNGFAVWNWVLVVAMTMSFGYPILQFFLIGTKAAVGWGW
jgi:cytochrome c oxidase subunit 1